METKKRARQQVEGADESNNYSLENLKTIAELAFPNVSCCIINHSESQPCGYVPGFSKPKVLTGHEQDGCVL